MLASSGSVDRGVLTGGALNDWAAGVNQANQEMVRVVEAMSTRMVTGSLDPK